jgi:opacity protein-like surface antigen
MNKALVIGAAAGALLAATHAARAEDNPSGAYAGAGWGQFNLDIDTLDEVGSSINDIANSDDNAWKVFVGYRINPYIAFEGAYVDFGGPSDRFDASGSDGNYRVDISGFAPYAIGTIPLGPVELFAKVGYYYYDVDVRVDVDDPGPDVESKHSESDFLYGGGIGVTLLDRLHLRVEYEAVDIDRAENSDAMWLSAAWRF